MKLLARSRFDGSEYGQGTIFPFLFTRMMHGTCKKMGQPADQPAMGVGRHGDGDGDSNFESVTCNTCRVTKRQSLYPIMSNTGGLLSLSKNSHGLP